jgi:hypothetical protein
LAAAPEIINGPLHKAHRWTEADFEKIGRESRALKVGARKAWDDEFASNAARIKKWAYAT